MRGSPFILGTVQLGMRYGIANQAGQPDAHAAEAIVGECLKGGIDRFDTAQHYGESETVLGAALQACGATQRARIITKLSPSLADSDAITLRQSVAESLARLNVPALDTIMLHREEQLALLDGAIGNALTTLVHEGIAARIGISVYTPDMALRALRHPLVDVVQLPASLFDRRFETAGVFQLARETNKEIHIRSVLLQGLLGMEPAALPQSFAELFPFLEQFHCVCETYGVPWAVAALAWARRRYPDAGILFGAESAAQARQNLEIFPENDVSYIPFMTELDVICPPQREALLNPALWQRKTHE